MKRRIIEALVPLTMWLLEHWPRKRRPSVMVLPRSTFKMQLLSMFERVFAYLNQKSKAEEADLYRYSAYKKNRKLRNHFPETTV